jgi:hypothetical protein
MEALKSTAAVSLIMGWQFRYKSKGKNYHYERIGQSKSSTLTEFRATFSQPRTAEVSIAELSVLPIVHKTV